MATQVNANRAPSGWSYDSLAVPLLFTALTTVITIPVTRGATRLAVQILPLVQALTNFQVNAQFSTQGAMQTINAAITATQALPIVAASGTLAALAAGTVGWFLMDVTGLQSVSIQAQCAVASTGTLDVHATMGPDTQP